MPPEDKKLTLVVRVESGCLGPNGAEVIEDFCRSAHTEFGLLYSDLIIWRIEARIDKALPEMDYYIADKRLDQAKATKYLALFGYDLSEIEAIIEERLATLIDQYLGY